MGEEPGHDAVHIALEHTGHVRHDLTPAESDFGVLQRHRVTSEPSDPHIKGYSGAYRGLLEHERDRAPGQRLFPPEARLDPAREVQDPLELARIELRDIDEVGA